MTKRITVSRDSTTVQEGHGRLTPAQRRMADAAAVLVFLAAVLTVSGLLAITGARLWQIALSIS